jgi:glycosyltransferase involved in cell wall biosynthesis
VPASEPLVSVGVPVRNGAATLRWALDSVCQQSHRNLEIVISDNASDDSTLDICSEYAARDSRVRVLRQTTVVPPFRNFRTVFEAARGDYFLFAAHDDSRSENYVAVLLEALNRHPQGVLAFPDVVSFAEPFGDRKFTPEFLDFETVGLGLLERLRKTSLTLPFHVYGLMRSESLRGYPWYECAYAPDWPLMLFLAGRGEFVRGHGACFFYYRRTYTKTDFARDSKRFGAFFRERVAWTSADAVRRSCSSDERCQGRVRFFLRVYSWQNRGWKAILFSRSPPWIQRAWHTIRGAR